MNEAEGEKAAILSAAEGDKKKRTETARGDVAVFDKLYAEYRNNKEITRSRLVIETLEQVLPKAEIYIMNDDGNTLKYLPLRNLESQVPATAAKDQDSSVNQETQKKGGTSNE